MPTDDSQTHLRVERLADGVVRLVLDNPAQRNAMSDEMTASWTDAIAELSTDRSVRVVVVTGAGTAFCSGGNTGWIASEPDASFGDEVLAVAAEVAATAPIPSRYTKVALRDGGHPDLETAIQWEALAQPITLATADLQEGIAAAKEKRPAVFRGL